MDNASIPYQTPHGALLNQPEQTGGLYHAVVLRGGIAHAVVVIKEEGAEVLVSGPTFYGWVAQLSERRQKEDDNAAFP